MKLIIYLATGGAIGTLARYGLQGLVQPAGSSFPWGTLAANLLGSFAIGFLMRFLLGVGAVGPELRAALTIGFCGSFTTMSTLSYETVALVSGGQHWRAGWYLASTVGGSITATVVGMAAGARLL